MYNVIKKDKLDTVLFEPQEALLRIRDSLVTRYESYEDYTLISFDWYDLSKKIAEPQQIVVCYTKQELLFVCEGDESYNLVTQTAILSDFPHKILYSFFFNLIKFDVTCIEELEEQITKVENDVLKTANKDCIAKIVSFRKELLQMKKYYEQLNFIFEELLENENGLIDEQEIARFHVLDNKVDRLFAHVLNLRDYVTQVREAYQAAVDIELNNLMKFFTVLSAFFMPLTLIVGWYGMNLQMPEFSWRYGYFFVIALSAFVVIFFLYWFKRKKWI